MRTVREDKQRRELSSENGPRFARCYGLSMNVPLYFPVLSIWNTIGGVVWGIGTGAYMEESCGWQGLLKVTFGVLFHLNF